MAKKMELRNPFDAQVLGKYVAKTICGGSDIFRLRPTCGQSHSELSNFCCLKFRVVIRVDLIDAPNSEFSQFFLFNLETPLVYRYLTSGPSYWCCVGWSGQSYQRKIPRRSLPGPWLCVNRIRIYFLKKVW